MYWDKFVIFYPCGSKDIMLRKRTRYVIIDLYEGKKKYFLNISLYVMLERELAYVLLPSKNGDLNAIKHMDTLRDKYT